MSIFGIAFNNFKNNLKVYTMFIVAMTFSVIILSNFEILINGNTIKYLESIGTSYCNELLKLVTIILIVFMVFYIWYAANIFIRNRKKEIGIYAFMGIDSYEIGKIYFIETMLVGIFSCVLGIALGVSFSKFFQIIIVKISGYDYNVSFDITPKGIINTIVIFMLIFLVMTIKGFINICRSKIIDLINANKKQDKMVKVNLVLYINGIIFFVITLYGYYLSTKIISDSLLLVVPTVILIIIGTFGLFGVCMSIIFSILIRKKNILYKGENIISINNVAYRLRKNYRVYAIIAIIITSTITVLGTSVAMKNTYEKKLEYINSYTFSYFSKSNINQSEIKNMIEGENTIKYSVNTNFLYVDKEVRANTGQSYNGIIILNQDEFLNILKTTEENKVQKELINKVINNGECIYIRRPGTIVEIGSGNSATEFNLEDQKLNIIKKIDAKVLGFVDFRILVVNDDDYNTLSLIGNKMNFYGVKLENEKNLNSLYNNLENKIDKDNTTLSYFMREKNSIKWTKFVYAIGVFLFFVFMLCTGSIIYMKIYNDAHEDKDKYSILLKIGADQREISNSIRKEVTAFYGIPLAIAAIHSYFAINVLSEFLKLNLIKIYFVSLGVCILLFAMLCIISMKSFKKIIRI